MSIYSEIILDHYRYPRNQGKISKPTITTRADNPLCGDKISVDILIKDGVIKDIKYKAEGCAISIAAASMLSEYLQGRTKDDLKKLDKDFMIKMLGIDLGPSRLKCALLPLETVQKIKNL